jgi:hypothetical protein
MSRKQRSNILNLKQQLHEKNLKIDSLHSLIEEQSIELNKIKAENKKLQELLKMNEKVYKKISKSVNYPFENPFKPIIKYGAKHYRAITKIQSIIRGYLCRKEPDNLKKEVCNLFTCYQTYSDQVKNLKSKININDKKPRIPNFPEFISENIAKNALYKTFKIHPQWKNNVGGDLKLGNKQIQVKCFTSNGPMSFGPTTKWDKMVFVDLKDQTSCKIYLLNLSNSDKIWKQIKVSKTQTFEQQAKAGRRPRMTFELLYHQIPTYFKEIYNGPVKNLIL